MALPGGDADADELAEILDRRLGFVTVGPGEQLRRLLALLVGRRPDASLEHEAQALLRLLGVDPAEAREVEQELEAVLEQARAAGIDPELAPPVTQAYVRAVGRIVEAEAESAREILRGVPPDDRAERLDRLLATLLPAAGRAFELLHTTLLRPALAEALSPERLTEPPTAPVAIALVDLTGSTRHLARNPAAVAEGMVDALFEAGQAATLDHPVRAIKYVGDGVFLAGADPSAVALAAFDALEHIERSLPLSARAGLAYGPLLRRAGDYFGLPVNLAQLLTKAASPGTLLATDSAAQGVPPALLGRRRRIRVRGVQRRLRVVTLVRPGPPAPRGRGQISPLTRSATRVYVRHGVVVTSGFTAEPTTAHAEHEHEQMEPVELLAKADRHLEAGELQEAESLYEEAARRLGHRHAVTLDNLALVYRLRGDVHRARQRLEETIDILLATKARGTPYHARALTNLGAVYLELGDHRGALRCYREARQILRRSAPGSVLLARTLDGMGAVFREERDFAHALKFHRQALKIFETLRPGTPDVARALFNVGMTYSAWGNLVGSLEYFERARDILEAFAPRSPDLAGVLSHIGAVHLMLREPQLALPSYERAIDILRAVAPRSPSMATALTGLALIHRDRGDDALAIPHLLRAVGIADSLREQAASPEDRAEVFARHESPYQALIGCLYARGDAGDAEEAFDLAEASRARALVELLAEVEHFAKEGARLRGETAEQRELLERQHELQDKLAANYKGLIRARQAEDAKRLQELGARDHELKAALRAVRARIRAAFPAYAEVRYPRPLTIQQVRKRLDPQALLLAFDATGDEAFVWAVRPKDFGMFRISAGGDRLAELVKEAVGRYRAEQPSDARVRAAHDELSRLLLEPVPSRFWDGVEFVIVIPDAHLHYLPLEVLSAPHAKDPLVERYAVAYAPSATALDGLGRRSATTASRGEFVGFGHALPSARGEVEAIARAFVARGAISLGPYLDRDATELRAKSESAGVRFVHFATHGEFNDERPELSGLHLAAPLPEEKATDARADDFLQVYEMFDLRLSAEAVICSSCETGLGNVNPGEGMVGMSQALFFAGARCVVVTLWPVRDEPTRELMERFYGYLVEGYSLAESLRAAKRDVRRWFPDPYYWAAFVAVGAAWDPASAAPAAKLESRDDLRRFLGRIRDWRLDDAGWAEAQRSLERFGAGLDEVREALSTLAALSASRLPSAFGPHAARAGKRVDSTQPPPELVLEELNKLVHGLK